MGSYIPENMVKAIRQSPPIDVSIPYEAAWVKGKTILITGGASGFGAGFVRHWAEHGAAVIIGDINVEKGSALVQTIHRETGNQNVHFVHCDVTDWQSQVDMFKEAVRLSPHGGIDTVVANAGIAKRDMLQQPSKLSAAEPAKPDLKIMDVNCTGVMYTTHLAYYWLRRNPGSEPCDMDSQPATRTRDRHLLLVGSIASLAPIAIQPQYGAAKHAVLGLFRSLRSTSHPQGIRVNLICPYFIDTPIITPLSRMLIAGGAMGRVEDVVDAATRLVADSRILGRALVIGPKVTVKQKEDGEWELVNKGEEGSTETAVWEPYADDWLEVDAWDRNFVKLINSVQAARGWAGWAGDMVKAIKLALGYGRS
ncbi:NAD(P)-binding protein [Amniculicola lignicola CBS 123094]|uniref:NAD(P)-binding protein n=1 Tax=Amniculicola lignicola CBS 123094 TaxID=1392246 RepID=A0A6A5WFL1_9PLEO|nr:NAD(P)-binding protein [Amniculicola lignicola CBS 123094]